MKRILREPLTHFALGGMLLFALFQWRHRDPPESADAIHVTAAQIRVLIGGWTRVWQRPPTQAEIVRLIDEHIREEVYSREALKLGLEKNDTIIRRRLRQKMEFLAEDFLSTNDPGDEQLQLFLDEHSSKFQEPAQLSFRHIYFNSDLRGGATEQDAEQVLRELTADVNAATVASQGDPTMLQREFDSATEDEVARVLGADFVSQVLALPNGAWSSPLKSGFGYHLVQVTNRTERRVPPLAEIRDAVLREWQFTERKSYAEEFYQGLKARYVVHIDMSDIVALGE